MRTARAPGGQSNYPGVLAGGRDAVQTCEQTGPFGPDLLAVTQRGAARQTRIGLRRYRRRSRRGLPPPEVRSVWSRSVPGVALTCGSAALLVQVDAPFVVAVAAGHCPVVCLGALRGALGYLADRVGTDSRRCEGKGVDSVVIPGADDRRGGVPGPDGGGGRGRDGRHPYRGRGEMTAGRPESRPCRPWRRARMLRLWL
jgi:hypothetical protein